MAPMTGTTMIAAMVITVAVAMVIAMAAFFIIAPYGRFASVLRMAVADARVVIATAGLVPVAITR